MGCFLFRRNTSCWLRHLAGGTDQMGTKPAGLHYGVQASAAPCDLSDPPLPLSWGPGIHSRRWALMDQAPPSRLMTGTQRPTGLSLGQPRKRPFLVFPHPLRPSLVGLSTRGLTATGLPPPSARAHGPDALSSPGATGPMQSHGCPGDLRAGVAMGGP